MSFEKLSHNWQIKNVSADFIEEYNQTTSAPKLKVIFAPDTTKIGHFEEEFFDILAENMELKNTIAKQQKENEDLRRHLADLKPMLARNESLVRDLKKQLLHFKNYVFKWLALQETSITSSAEQGLRQHMMESLLKGAFEDPT
jgi:hypothetical protein